MMEAQERKTLYNNGDTPFVLMDSGDEHPGRGDVHGSTGLAMRIAEKTGAKLMFLDENALKDMYPEVTARTLRLKKFFTDHGIPDFYFTRKLLYGDGVSGFLNANGCGLILQSYNESFSYILNQYHSITPGDGIVPHHLTPEILRHEGMRFAQEYAELPRPFIGVNLSSLSGKIVEDLAHSLGRLRYVYNEASIFITSSHSTDTTAHDNFLGHMKLAFNETGERFPVINFDYKFQMENHGAEDVWNPYIGLLDQTDHIIVEGYSRSMVSEALMTGKTVHVTKNQCFEMGLDSGYLRNIFSYAANEPLGTRSIPPVDRTGEIADAIIAKYKQNMMEITTPKKPEGTMGKIIRFITGKSKAAEKPRFEFV